MNAPRIRVGTQSEAFSNWDLFHEYGHFLHYTVTGIAGAAIGGAMHTATQVFPDSPLLPWLEGFADAFASIATDNPRPMRDCKPLQGIDLLTAPAQPLPDDPSKAQYNEIAIAGVLWHLADALGAGSAQNGLRLVVHAIHELPPQSAREFLDALIHDPATGNASNGNLVFRIFADQHMRWLIGVQFANLDSRRTNDGIEASNAVQMAVDGPYGRCTPSGTNRIPTAVGTPFPAFGDIPWSSRDDCSFLQVSDGGTPPACPTSSGPDVCSPTRADAGGFILDLPYKANESHLTQPFTVSARWLCTRTPSSPQDSNHSCTATRSFEFTAFRFTSTDGQGGQKRSWLTTRSRRTAGRWSRSPSSMARAAANLIGSRLAVAAQRLMRELSPEAPAQIAGSAS